MSVVSIPSAKTAFHELIQYFIICWPVDHYCGKCWSIKRFQVDSLPLFRAIWIWFVLCFCCGSDGKESVCNAGDPGSIPGLGKSPGRKVWQPTPVFLPEKSHGQSSLVVCSPWGHKKWDITGQLTVSHPQILWAALSLSISKFMCWTSNLQYLRMWLSGYLLKRWLN